MSHLQEIAQRLRALSAISPDRCSVVATNAVLAHFKKPLLTPEEYPRSLLDMTFIMDSRGLKAKANYAHMAKDKYTLADALAQFSKGVYFLQSSQHVMALINGKLTDTEGAGTRRQVLVWEVYEPTAAQIKAEEDRLRRNQRRYK